jgi:membrane-anchored protein YejM (alkaline phosphatase superfamily)
MGSDSHPRAGVTVAAPAGPDKRRLWRWAGWFAAANAGLLALAGVRFLWLFPFSPDALGLSYVVLTFAGHFALLAALPVGLIVLPLLLIAPRRGLIMPLAVVLSALGLTLLVVDGNVFAEQRYHLTPLTAVLFEASTWLLVGIIGITALMLEAVLGQAVWRWVDGNRPRHGGLVAITLVGAWIASQAIHIWADAIGHTPVTQLTRYLPAYFPIHAKRTLARLGLVDEATVARQRLLRKAVPGGGGQLNYPLRPLQCVLAAPVPNILIVLIDALRPDVIDARLLPNLAALREEGQHFNRHASGGNSSRAGLFAMFYGLPATYWEAFYGLQQPPLLMDQVRAAGHGLGLFAAPGFGTPTDIGRTVFAGISGLPGERHDITAVARNRAVTDEWLVWLGGHDAIRPFFGFLYYDPPMGEMSADPDAALPLNERFAGDPDIERLWRQYRRAAQFADGELGRVVAALRERGLLDRTLLIVTSDHGYEFDDNGLGYIGHASSYSQAQVRATLIMRWPGRPSVSYDHRTSHFDLPVTLLQEVFGCTNPPEDYSVGRNLFAGQSWDWLVTGSYNSHAILQPDRVIVTHPGGFVEALGEDYRPLSGARLDASVIEAALRDMRRFYR